MKKARRILTVLLLVNFFIGMESGMEAVNLVMVIVNAALVILAAALEIKKNRR